MYLISQPTVSATVLKAFETIDLYGIKQETRNGYAKAIHDVTLEIENPRSRHLFLAGRKSNIFQMIAETFWVLAGDNRIDPYLSFFLPRAANYSDDGVTWHGAYGPRLYQYNQLQDIVEIFKADGLDTRRAVLNIAMPEFDSRPSIADRYGKDHKPKDIPCNREIHFYVINNKFTMKVIQRSGDVLFGAGSINPFEFTFLQELIYNEVKKSYPDLELGSYKWHVTNLHVYSEFEQQIFDALENDGNHWCCYDENDMPMITSDGVNSNREFFSDIVGVLTRMIQTTDVMEYITLMSSIKEYMDHYNVPLENNILSYYIGLVVTYIGSKKGFDTIHYFDMKGCDEEFVRSIKLSPFCKFEVAG